MLTRMSRESFLERGFHHNFLTYLAGCAVVVGGIFLVGWTIQRWRIQRFRLKALGGRAAAVARLPLGLDIAFGLTKSWFFDGLVEYATTLLESFGRTTDLEVLGMRLVFTDEPENFEAIMSTKFTEYGKGINLHKTWQNLMGDSIFATDGAVWETSKRLLHPHLTKTRPSDFDRTEQHIQQLLERISGGGSTVDISDLSSRFALDVVTHIFLEESASSLKTENFPFGQAMDKLQAYNTIRTVFGYLGSLFPTLFVRGSMREVDQYLDIQVQRMLQISAYSSSGKDTQSGRLVDSLRLNSRHKDIKDQVIAVLIAGRDPFGLSLAWALYELSRNPEIVRKLRSEIIECIGLNERPTFPKLQRMSYLKNIVREILRLYPPLGFNVRTALEDTSLPLGGGPNGQDPVGILKGTQIAFSVLSLHRRTDISGADASAFRPERWESWEPRKWEYVPFNHGPRVCLGRSFAINQLRYTLCRLFQEFEGISPAAPEVEKKALRVELNIKPASPITCTFHAAGMPYVV